MCGIVTNHKCKTYVIYCNPDYTYIFVGMHPTISTSKLMKSGSSKWLNEKDIFWGNFRGKMVMGLLPIQNRISTRFELCFEPTRTS